MIRTRVVIFSFSYISGHSVSNFVLLYVRFIIRIIWLVLNNNFYWIIFGWDGLGVVSFLLIIFYINQERARNGLFTLFQNRLGDLFFVFFILGLIDIAITNQLFIKVGVIFLVIGGSVKRAQYPFNAWLLAAIRAPTPISSLVHSSTLVVAGVYILLQFSYCLRDVLFLLKYIRLLTLVVSSFGLLNELDIKKLIAYSTISHVSLIIYILSFKLIKIVYFHLNIHAIFKSLIFICFGFVILISFHGQDKRLVSLLILHPWIKIIYYFSCFCLAGLPILRAFFSKDFIIEYLVLSSSEFSYILLLMGFLRVRIYYSIKLLNLGNVHFSLTKFEFNSLGLVRVSFITFIIILFINVFLSFIFSLSLEIFSRKIFIYIFIFILFFLRIYSNLSIKLFFYSKFLNFKEIWSVNFYYLDLFIYWNMFVFLSYVSVFNKIKIFLLINWWFIFLLIYLF